MNESDALLFVFTSSRIIQCFSFCHLIYFPGANANVNVRTWRIVNISNTE